ncbi:unnamed protein product [Microthlaspi erraticum]|uniref:F-box domain-containing protein n=1 Tax=Microthlaspi erraticum TaxID=1685480 RepID=A0A6D2JZM0_9BRAS|nr:unnamed protein product [Microthlaspi erraticum]
MEKLEQQFSENLLITSTSETQPPKSVREHYSDPIPVDLLVEIFSRVPADSIARFRCVSKFWGYILGRPDFTELFLTKSSTRPRLLFTLTADDGKLLFYSSPQPQNPDDNSTVVATRYHTSSYTYFPSWYSNKILGLVLLHKTYNRKVRLICNPVTGDFLTLPKLLVEDKTITGVEARAKAINGGIHLGYDPIRKQFKVLRMNLSCGERPNTHHVLTLEYGKRLWRSIGCKYHFIENGRKFGEVCINGVLYFGAVLGRYWVIVCFDVR